MDRGRLLGGIASIVGGGLWYREPIIWVMGKVLDKVTTSLSLHAVSLLDICAALAILAGPLILLWPRIVHWWRKPSLEDRTNTLANLIADRFDTHMNQIAIQAAEIAILKSRLDEHA